MKDLPFLPGAIPTEDNAAKTLRLANATANSDPEAMTKLKILAEATRHPYRPLHAPESLK